MSEKEPENRQKSWATRKLFSSGTDPDPRFTLANERTFLAWIRTSLALLAGGIAVEMFTVEIFSALTRQMMAVSLILLALFISAPAFSRWLSVERAMREKRPLPFPALAPILCIGVSIVIAVFAYSVINHAKL